MTGALARPPPGSYTLDVSPSYRIVRVAESRDDDVLINVVTVAARVGTVVVRGFLHEITIEENDISMMGLSGIGFALRAGAAIGAPPLNLPTNDPKGALLAYIDAAVLSFGLVPLLRAADPVRDLVIIGNRIHHNLRNPFTEVMRATSQIVGQAGVSLVIVESVVISGNHVYENGPRATDPVCGVFIGYGDDLEITDNCSPATARSPTTSSRTGRRDCAAASTSGSPGALTSHSSASSGRKPARCVCTTTGWISRRAGR